MKRSTLLCIAAGIGAYLIWRKLRQGSDGAGSFSIMSPVGGWGSGKLASETRTMLPDYGPMTFGTPQKLASQTRTMLPDYGPMSFGTPPKLASQTRAMLPDYTGQQWVPQTDMVAAVQPAQTKKAPSSGGSSSGAAPSSGQAPEFTGGDSWGGDAGTSQDMVTTKGGQPAFVI